LLQENRVSEVRLLANQVIDQIAAGEVVERPASVIKELVENALDAGATQIDISMRDGGREQLRVADNGSGMSRQDALMAIERHATSKIRVFEDLERVATLGFRGEALPSIAAVSRFELITRRPDEEVGTKIRIESGTLRDVSDVGAPVGTVIDVRQLFHTLPARRAFLRTPPTELSHCVESVIRVALIRPGVGFEVRHEDRLVLRASKTLDPAERVREILGSDADELQPVDLNSDGGLRLVGLVAPPNVHRPSLATALYVYVNGRWVRDQVVRRAVGEVYRGMVPEGRHPVVVLDLRVPPGAVDVNVHPTKAEVRFRDPSGVGVFITDSLRSALGLEPVRHGAPPSPDLMALPFRAGPQPTGMSSPLEMPPGANLAGPSAAPFAGPFAGPFSRPTEPPGPSISALPDGLPPPLAAEPPPAYPPPVPSRVLPPGSPSTQTASWAQGVVGLVRDRWILIEEGQALWMVDGGRVARRKLAWAAQGPPQRLLVPQRVHVVAREIEMVEANDRLAELGLLVGRFSPNELAVRAVPLSLGDVDPADLLRVAIRALLEGIDVREAWGRELPPVTPITADVLEGIDWRPAIVGKLPIPT
jgi:DNA mismatch repair protein MutL